ncbi:hypothetical protein EX895_004525 [Sporisorium graminicola]|uniref:Uncharacterized protein n=1 Tax=Sporisorium graminicola TaxID=280036 RepID=A0A4U7KQV7_9BASI|nr:hypothetical protein EX895_004525 [Sporisorium graminicola]TKY86376.1 hypothetical protein EX895_004525 [Sporisorium graminicola]
MPAVRTTPRDVLIRVPKVEPYSNSYLPPSARAKEEAKKLAAAATTDNSANAVTAEPNAAASAAPADGTAATIDASTASTINAPTSATAPLSSAEAAAPETAGASAAGADAANKPDADEEAPADRRQRGNSPTLPFLDVDRQEEQTVELSKAATSSAGWNSLLVWARRQRGAQWDASTALWQVDKYSREYYSFAEHPATTDRSKQPGGEAAETETGVDVKQPQSAAAGDEDDDKGPTRVSSRNRSAEQVSGTNASPPPVALGRSARLLRR